MADYSIYTISNGRIVRVLKGFTAVEIVDQVDSATENFVEGDFYTEDYYVTGGVATLRPIPRIGFSKTTFNADGIDFITFSSIPNPTTVEIYSEDADNDGFYDNKNTTTVTDGTLDFNAVMSGNYRLIFPDFPNKPLDITVTGV